LKNISFFGVVLASSFANANPAKSIDICSSFDTAGYSEIDASGRKTGFEIELAEAIFGSQGYEVNWIVRPWKSIVADLAQPSGDKKYLYISSTEGREDRRGNWLFAPATEYDAAHYMVAKAGFKPVLGNVVDSKTGNAKKGFPLHAPEGGARGRKLRVASWYGSALHDELKRVYAKQDDVEVLGLEGEPADWLKSGRADIVYIFASGPKNAYTGKGLAIVAGPIKNFDSDRFAGTSPAMPMSSFGQDMSRVWLAGFAHILRDDTFFRISKRWFGRVAWPFETNSFLIPDEAAFRERIRKAEEGL
jgi:hypothetical protein